MSMDEKALLEKFEEVLAVSQRVRRARVAKYLGITEDGLFPKLIEWGKTLPFKLDEGVIVVNDQDDFAAALEQEFAKWERADKKSNENDRTIEPLPESASREERTDESDLVVIQALESHVGTRLPILPRGEEAPVGIVLDESDRGTVRRVTGLRLRGQGLTDLPELLGNLDALTHLDLANNDLERLPPSMKNLTALEVLTVSRNALSRLPVALRDIVLPVMSARIWSHGWLRLPPPIVWTTGPLGTPKFSRSVIAMRSTHATPCRHARY